MVDSGGDYFSIDAVLAEETAIPCHFQCGAQGIGRAVDPSSGEPNLTISNRTCHIMYQSDILTAHDI